MNPDWRSKPPLPRRDDRQEPDDDPGVSSSRIEVVSIDRGSRDGTANAVVALRRELSRLTQQAVAVEKSLDEQRRDRSDAIDRLDRATEHALMLEGRLMGVEAEAQSLRRANESMAADLRKARNAREELAIRLEEANEKNRQAASSRAEIDEVREKLRAAESSESAARAELVTLRSELGRVKEESERYRAAASERIAILERVIDESNAASTVLRKDHDHAAFVRGSHVTRTSSSRAIGTLPTLPLHEPTRATLPILPTIEDSLPTDVAPPPSARGAIGRRSVPPANPIEERPATTPPPPALIPMLAPFVETAPAAHLDDGHSIPDLSPVTPDLSPVIPDLSPVVGPSVRPSVGAVLEIGPLAPDPTREQWFEMLANPSEIETACVELRKHPEWLSDTPPPALLQALSAVDDDIDSPVIALARAWDREPLCNALLSALRAEEDVSRREHYAWLLKHLAAPSSWRALADLAKSDDENVSVRKWLLEALDRLAAGRLIGWAELGDVLTTVMRHPDPSLRDSVVGILVSLDRSDDKRRLLLEILRNDEDESVLASAVSALASVLPVSLDPPIVERLLGHASPRVQKSVLEFVDRARESRR
ncbi:MAG: hypothetical protein FWD69_07600 [Polyangiaceae bacterium]|nr:hypothetical protein [Polyangiaceae bacterium]